MVIGDITSPFHLKGIYMDKLLYLTNNFFYKGNYTQGGKFRITNTKYFVLGLEQSFECHIMSRIMHGC